MDQIIFIFKGYGFEPYGNSRGSMSLHGPLCPAEYKNEKKCLCVLEEWNNHMLCPVCSKQYPLSGEMSTLMNNAHKAYKAYLRSGKKIITLDIPVSTVKAEDEDAFHKVSVVLSQKDGRKQAIIYICEREKKVGKTHIFADIDREELRYDPSDIAPGEILVKLTAEFKNAISSIQYK